MSGSTLARAVATIGAAAAASCAPNDRAFTVDPVFTETQRATIASAGQKWGEILEEPITFEGGSWRITRGAVPDGYVAWTDADKREVTIAPDVADDDLYRAVLHELGHSVGFVHHDAPGVMNPRAGTDFSAADRAECAALNRCR